MKKTYIHPEMEIVEIQGQVLLAGSPVGANVYDDSADGATVLAPETHYWEF
jgi:hypothetical protein